jgi:hypothetical protein
MTSPNGELESSPLEALTELEQVVARMVGSGKTNREGKRPQTCISASKRSSTTWVTSSTNWTYARAASFAGWWVARTCPWLRLDLGLPGAVRLPEPLGINPRDGRAVRAETETGSWSTETSGTGAPAGGGGVRNTWGRPDEVSG